MRSRSWIGPCLVLIGCAVAIADAQAQLTCQADADCASLSSACVDAECLFNFCVTQARPANTPCDELGQCVDAVCDGAGTCVATGPTAPGTSCDDGVFCTQSDACDGAGICEGVVQPGMSCNDGNFCSLDDLCDESGACVPGSINPDPLCSQSVPILDQRGFGALSVLLLAVGVWGWAVTRRAGSSIE